MSPISEAIVTPVTQPISGAVINNGGPVDERNQRRVHPVLQRRAVLRPGAAATASA
jgi:hypothetical protein